ncbi:MAG TPA: glycosyltransferase family 2 protein [Actinomycetota bacterium]|nr:glycosyltransferase family 2 protein [Actinomycetota bacterium]
MTTRVTYADTRAESTDERSIPSVLAIVVTHDAKDWLRQALIGLNAQKYPMLDVLVVDDASRRSLPGPPLRRIAKRHLRRRRWGFVRTPRSLGFGGAINWALSRVRTDADLLLFLHDDAILEPGSLEKMVGRIMAEDSTAIVGPKVVSWEDPTRLEEVGMAVDRLGYPYKGLEQGEIDLGQHDRSTEVFFVTSTCMLVRHDVFRSLKGWDARMRAFVEDLDLCWRARIAGHEVKVEPAAKVRHLMGLATGQRTSPYLPARYFIRRNRLRTMTKNVSGVRVLALYPIYLILLFLEAVGFALLRQPGEILNLAKAFGWNLISLPQTLSERARIQRTRRVPDRRLRRLTVRESTRVRSYVHHQAERIEEAWGRRAELIARRGEAARQAGSRLKGWPVAALVLGALALTIAFRHILFDPPAAVGELLPYPERATALFRAWASPWKAVGLGESGPTLPAFALLGFFPLLTLGAAGAAQKLLIITLGVMAFIGAAALVRELVDKPSRYAAGAAYALGAVGYSGVREGSLGAMVFGAAAPFVLLQMIRLIGWVRPPNWNRSRSVARVALGSAISAAFVPGSLVLYFVVAVMLAATRTFLDRGAKALRGVLATSVALAIGWLLLLPWSATWFVDGGALSRLTTGDTWRLYAAGFAGDGTSSVLLGQTPDFPALPGLALPLLGLIAVGVGIGQRRHMALAFWTVIAADAWLVGAMSSGALRPFVASSTEAAVPASVAFAGLVGLAVAAFRQDLPRRGLGLLHAVTLGGFGLAVFMVVSGMGPALVRGDWAPGRDSGRIEADAISQIRDVLEIEAEIEGQSRALWIGEGWSSPNPSIARPTSDYMITGPRGQVLSDLYETKTGGPQAVLERAVASIREGTTDRGGGLLGAFNIRFVVLERGPGTSKWLAQRDLGLIRTEDEYLMLENQIFLERAAIYAELPSELQVLQTGDTSLSFAKSDDAGIIAEQRSSSHYVADSARPGTAVITESYDPGWEATLDGAPLERVDTGWANGFEVPTGGRNLSIEFPRGLTQIIWLVVIVAGWVLAFGAAFGRTPRAAINEVRR